MTTSTTITKSVIELHAYYILLSAQTNPDNFWATTWFGHSQTLLIIIIVYSLIVFIIIITYNNDYVYVLYHTAYAGMHFVGMLVYVSG